MLRDNGDEISTFSNKTETWISSGYTGRPVTYVSGRKAVIDCEIAVKCESLDPRETRLFIKGINSDGYNLPARLATVSSNFIRYKKTAVDLVFQEFKVDYFQEFDMTWYVSTAIDAPDGEWIKVGRTYAELYVLHDDPILDGISGAGAPTMPYLTLIHLGCKNAKGQLFSEDIVNKMYNEFLDQDVRTYNGDGPMTYWRPDDPAPAPYCFLTFGLINFLDSRCHAWAAFFIDMIRIQGIENSEFVRVDWNYTLSEQDEILQQDKINSFFGEESVNVMPYPYRERPTGPVLGDFAEFLVNKWNIHEGEDVFILSEFDPNNETVISLNNGNKIYYKEQDGVPAQGVGHMNADGTFHTDPRSEFNNHAMVKYGNKYYDPSYGTPARASANLWETASISAFASVLTYNKHIGGGVIKTYVILWLAHFNDPTLQATINP